MTLSVDYPPEASTLAVGSWLVLVVYLALLVAIPLVSLRLPLEGSSSVLKPRVTAPDQGGDAVDGGGAADRAQQPVVQTAVNIPQLETIEGFYVQCRGGSNDYFSSSDDSEEVDGGLTACPPVTTQTSCNSSGDPEAATEEPQEQIPPLPLKQPPPGGDVAGDVSERLFKIVSGQDPTARVVVKHKKTDMVKRRGVAAVTVDSLATVCDEYLYQSKRAIKSKLYAWLVAICCVFYTLPAAQVMVANQATALQRRSGDICYYNFLCRVQWGFQDFGHVFSNLSYVACGLAFIVLVTCRKIKRHNKILQEIECPGCLQPPPKPKVRHRCHKASLNREVAFIARKGIPEQYGIFYALGGALVAEGFLSATYHICPTNESFQFDTTFMYIIAILMFLKVYQFRHPDVTANAYKVFSVVCLALVIEVIGYYSSDGVFWLFFISSYLTVLLVFAVEIYFNGNFSVVMRILIKKFNVIQLAIALSSVCCGCKTEDFNQWRKDNSAEIKKWRDLKRTEGLGRRHLLFIGVLLTNIGLATFFGVKQKPGVSRYLLGILSVNLLLYVLFYCAMKLKLAYIKKNDTIRGPGERISWRCVIYFALGIALSLVGVYFFAKELKTTSKSPAESRNINEPCQLLFFDNHDIWHFASAGGLFFMFMALMTLEDNNYDIPWEDIPVF